MSHKTSSLNWADAVNSLKGIGIKSIRRLSASETARGSYRMVQQTELKPTNFHRWMVKEKKAGNGKLYRHKRARVAGNHKKKPLKLVCDEGRITDNEENYPYIEMVRRFQSWGLCEVVDEENPFPSVLFSMKEFTSDVNKKMKDEKLLSMDEEGMKGIWMKVLNKTSGQSLVDISDVSIGDDNLLTPSPKLSWVNNFEPTMARKTGEQALTETDSRLLKDLLFQRFYGYERLLFDLLTQKDAAYGWPCSKLDLECFKSPEGALMVDWSRGKGGIKEVLSGKLSDGDQALCCDRMKEEVGADEVVDCCTGTKDSTDVTEDSKETALRQQDIFDESLHPRFSTPKYPKLDGAGQKYQAVRMLGVEDIHPANQIPLTSCRRRQFRVKLEELYGDPVVSDPVSDSESELGDLSNSLLELCHFEEMDNDADDECRSVSTIIFSDDDDEITSESLSSSASLSKSLESESPRVMEDGGGKEANKVESLFRSIGVENADEKGGDAGGVRSGGGGVVMSLSNDSFFLKNHCNESFPMPDVNNNYQVLPLHTDTKAQDTLPSLPCFLPLGDNVWESQPTAMESWDRFIATPTSTKELITFSQSKLNCLVTNTDTLQQHTSVSRLVPFRTDLSGDLADNKLDSSLSKSAFRVYQSSLLPTFAPPLVDTSPLQNADFVNNNLTSGPKYTPEQQEESGVILEVANICTPDKNQSLPKDYKRFKPIVLSSQENLNQMSLSFSSHNLPMSDASKLETVGGGGGGGGEGGDEGGGGGEVGGEGGDGGGGGEGGRGGESLSEAEEPSPVRSCSSEVHTPGSLYPQDCKEAGDSILEVVSDHLNMLREEFEKGVLKERLVEEEEEVEEEWCKRKVDHSREEFSRGWELAGVLFNQLECQKDFAYEAPQVAFY